MPVEFLGKLGLKDFRGGGVIPYWDENGKKYI
jgi:hypothetical protein